LRALWREKQVALSSTRESLNAIERAARETESRIAAIADALERFQDGLVEAHERLTEAETALDLMSDDDDIEPELEAAQAETERQRAAVLEARSSLDRIAHEARARAGRLAGAKAEHER
jgi:chromosome segregation protein